jgi:hypothetical protein
MNITPALIVSANFLMILILLPFGFVQMRLRNAGSASFLFFAIGLLLGVALPHMK